MCFDPASRLTTCRLWKLICIHMKNDLDTISDCLCSSSASSSVFSQHCHLFVIHTGSCLAPCTSRCTIVRRYLRPVLRTMYSVLRLPTELHVQPASQLWVCFESSLDHSDLHCFHPATDAPIASCVTSLLPFFPSSPLPFFPSSLLHFVRPRSFCPVLLPTPFPVLSLTPSLPWSAVWSPTVEVDCM